MKAHTGLTISRVVRILVMPCVMEKRFLPLLDVPLSTSSPFMFTTMVNCWLPFRSFFTDCCSVAAAAFLRAISFILRDSTRNLSSFADESKRLHLRDIREARHRLWRGVFRKLSAHRASALNC